MVASSPPAAPASSRARRLHPAPALVAAVLLAGLAADTWLALTHSYLPFDLPLTRAVQSVDWGPLAATFGLFTWLAGLKQLAGAMAAVVLVFLVNRRATWMLIVGSACGAIYQSMNVLIHRPRPDSNLVHAVAGQHGYGYPSGHAAFFLAFSVLLVYALGARRPSRGLLVAGWALAALIVFDTCVARVYVGAHWPSDVAGGLCLGGFLVATAFAIGPISDPVREQWRGV